MKKIFKKAIIFAGSCLSLSLLSPGQPSHQEVVEATEPKMTYAIPVKLVTKHDILRSLEEVQKNPDLIDIPSQDMSPEITHPADPTDGFLTPDSASQHSFAKKLPHDTFKVVEVTKLFDNINNLPKTSYYHKHGYSGMISLVSVHRSLDGWQVTYSGPVVKDGPNL